MKNKKIDIKLLYASVLVFAGQAMAATNNFTGFSSVNDTVKAGAESANTAIGAGIWTIFGLLPFLVVVLCIGGAIMYAHKTKQGDDSGLLRYMGFGGGGALAGMVLSAIILMALGEGLLQDKDAGKKVFQNYIKSGLEAGSGSTNVFQEVNLNQ